MGDRKYRQRGYMDEQEHESRARDDRRPRGPKLPIDVTGPRLPRMVQTVVAARCFNCSTTLPPGTDFTGNCPKCNAALHCCKQCAHFEPSARLQCLKPILVRIGSKDKPNECELFETRVTVARDATSVTTSPYAPTTVTPRTPQDARAAFDNLFKK
ncbi:MAG: hypothetical protein KIT09_22055 [Bryobacteraceae bacterium]|nr:hypothetical protein [Bryobacteraceae bacterium]